MLVSQLRALSLLQKTVQIRAQLFLYTDPVFVLYTLNFRQFSRKKNIEPSFDFNSVHIVRKFGLALPLWAWDDAVT
jgi:hypothetical protein